MAVATPIVHLNGSSASVLLAANRTAHASISTALDNLKAAEPNGRDYYLVAGRYEVARAEHVARLAALEKVQRELHEIIMSLFEQAAARAR